MEFEFHLQSPCGSPSTQLWDFRQSTRSGIERECKKNIEKHVPMVMTSLLMSSPPISISHLLPFPAPPPEWPGELARRLLFFTETIMSLSPSPPPPNRKKKKDNYITIVFTFSWVLQTCQEKSKTVVMQNFGSKQGALWSRWNCGWSQLINLNHNPARATPILYLCHGVFTDPFIFRQILGHFFPRKYRIHTRKT